MKLNLDPMPALRLVAAGKVNAHFDGLARPHRDAAHAIKRFTAKAGPPYADWFTQEADLRGITPPALACLILSKGDAVADRELLRQRAMAAIDTATTPTDLTSIVDKLRTP